MSSIKGSPAARLNALLVDAGFDSLDDSTAARFQVYLALLLRWNARVNLTAIRDEEGILARHFVESIACARALSYNIATLLDLGSGGGLPGIPIALCRPDLVVTLAESQGKKAAFLREAVRVLGIPVTVHSGRAEVLRSKFDCVILRAVDRMSAAVRVGAELVADRGWLALMTTVAEVERVESTAGKEFRWGPELLLPGGDSRLLVLGERLA